MKKIVTLILASVLLLSQVACGQKAATSAAEASKEGEKKLTKVCYMSAAWSDDYCKRLNDAIVELGPQYGMEVDAVNGAPTGQPDLTGYIEAIEAIAAKNPEGVIVQPLFSLPDYCLQFNEKKVPLCFVNIAPEISDTSKNLEYYYAGCFDTKIGEQLAEEMAKGLKQNAKIGVICLPYGQTNAEQRRTGFETWMKANRPDVQILEVKYVETNDPSVAQSIFEDWIQKYGVNGLDGVATQSSMQTQGIVSSMKSYDLNTSNFILAGISASTSEWVAEGVEYVDLYQDPYAEAASALSTLRAMLDGTTDKLTTLEGEYHCCAVPMTPVTIANADQFK